MRGKSVRGGVLSFGEFGLQALEPCWLTARQIEAGRIAITRHSKRKGKLWIRVFPWKPVTKKPTEVRMGKGKGDPEFWVETVKPGRILYELEGVPEDVAKRAMELAHLVGWRRWSGHDVGCPELLPLVDLSSNGRKS